MRIFTRILIFMVCLNLATGLVIELSLAGTEYVSPTMPTNSSEYQSHFNATETAEGWQATPYSGIPVIGDIFSAFQLMWRGIQYLIAGFPLFLNWLGDCFIIDASARVAYNVVVATLVAIQAILATLFVIEFISGRTLTE